MSYYYDIVLDFQESNYHFYDVEENDCFDYIKKIPLFQINNKTYKDIINYNIIIDKSFLKMIYNKTITNNGFLEYVCILADKNNCIVLEFSKEGNVLTRSILPLNEELSILEKICMVNTINLKYEKKEKLLNEKELKKEKVIKQLIRIEINKLCKENNNSKLKYLYYEWFGIKESNMDIMVKKMREKLDKNIGRKEEEILKIIKISYNRV